MSLIEMMLAVAVLALMAGALGMLTQAVRVSTAYADGTTAATQHARVALYRIDTAVSLSFANETFPGAMVFAATVGGYTYPDTLVVWRPAAEPAAPGGLPRFDEIVVFCPNPNAPHELLEITAPNDTRTVPDTGDLATWNTELAALKTGANSSRVVLSDLLRSAAPTGDPAAARGAVRFAVDLRPTAADWNSFRAATLAFASLSWPQSVYGAKAGLRQTRVSCELQLVCARSGAADRATLPPLTFFGSATGYGELRQ
ncbi:MAG: type II secretion system protein J [Pirellulales bacterium]